jgi:hypothetical protein
MGHRAGNQGFLWQFRHGISPRLTKASETPTLGVSSGMTTWVRSWGKPDELPIPECE